MPKDKSRQPKRLHRCEECGARRFVDYREANRATRPRCLACGSARLELVSEEAKEDAARLQWERVVRAGGSLKLSIVVEDTSTRKVT